MNVGSIPRLYAYVNSEKPKEYWDYENATITWANPDGIELISRVGRGKYSEVFEGVIRWDRGVKYGFDVGERGCIVKILKPVKSKKINREIRILEHLNNCDNIIKLYDVVQDPVSKTPSLIMEKINNTDYKLLYPKLTNLDIKYYLYQILLALDYSHSRGIMHRDVKPHNIMIDHKQKKLTLIDWGLAEFYHYGLHYNVRVASRYYKAPELLVDIEQYHYSLDSWSFGCVMAGMIFKMEPFFPGSDNNDQLVKIIKVLGGEEFAKYRDRYHLEENTWVKRLPLHRWKGQPWESFRRPENEERVSPEAIDLLGKLLRFDHNERLLPREAMAHPYFDPIRNWDRSMGEEGSP